MQQINSNPTTNWMHPARGNPLAVHRTDSLPFRFAEGNWEQHFKRLQAMRYRGAIVGPQGSGKTTLLDELNRELTERQIPCRLVRARSDKTTQREILRECRSLPAGTVVLLDSAEQLARWTWWQIVVATSTRECGLVVTVHRRCCSPTWIRCSTDERLLMELLTELGFSDEDANFRSSAIAFFKKRNGNIRETFRDLYDCLAAG